MFRSCQGRQGWRLHALFPSGLTSTRFTLLVMSIHDVFFCCNIEHGFPCVLSIQVLADMLENTQCGSAMCGRTTGM